MNEPNKNQTSERLPLETHVSVLETSLTAQQAILDEMNDKLDLLIKLQQEMHIDLRNQMADLNDTVTALGSTLHQIHRDIQSDSFQNRLMRMGQ